MQWNAVKSTQVRCLDGELKKWESASLFPTWHSPLVRSAKSLKCLLHRPCLPVPWSFCITRRLRQWHRAWLQAAWGQGTHSVTLGASRAGHREGAEPECRGTICPELSGVCTSLHRMSERTTSNWSPGSWVLALCLAWLWTWLASASLQPPTATGLGKVVRD